MDTLALLRSLATVVGFVGFIALVIWIFRRRDEDLYPAQDLFNEQYDRLPAAALESSTKPLAQKG